jgi:hypothetical protein
MKRLFLFLFASLSLHAQTPPVVRAPSENPLIQNGAVNSQIANSTVNAAMYPGSDMGVQINNAIAAVGCGEVLVPRGTYTVKTTIHKPRCVNLRGQSAYGTILNWPSTTGTGIVIADDGADTQYSEGEISDITIQVREEIHPRGSASISGEIPRVILMGGETIRT